MPLITIELLSGRTSLQKEQMAREVTRIVSSVSAVAQEDVWVRFVDVSPANWAIGGRLQSGTEQPGHPGSQD